MKDSLNDKIIKKVTIESFAAEGKCIAHYDDKVVFVEKVAPGDIVDIRIVKKKKKFLEGTPIFFHQYSKARSQAFCDHFGTCGGCKWQHINYQKQLEIKEQHIVDSLERIAKVRLPEINAILAAEDILYYRNKLEFTFSNKRWFMPEEIKTGEKLDRDALGFHVPKRFDRIIDIAHCYLQADPSNAIRLAIRDFSKENNLTFYDHKLHRGLLRNLIIRTSSLKQTMVLVQFGEDDRQHIRTLMEFIHTRFPALTSLLYVVNTKKNETFHDLEIKLFAGQSYITEKIGNLKFRIGPKSFFQTNTTQAYFLYKTALEFADLEGDEIVYDLYTGIGTIANFIAGHALKVVGLEHIPEAIADAKVNAEINGITNASFHAGDIKDLLSGSFIEVHGKPEVLITDPPRAGMHPQVIKKLLEILPEKIVYISCNPATQARDIALLDAAYEIVKVQPVDMFPHTHHVENVILLHKK